MGPFPHGQYQYLAGYREGRTSELVRHWEDYLPGLPSIKAELYRLIGHVIIMLAVTQHNRIEVFTDDASVTAEQTIGFLTETRDCKAG